MESTAFFEKKINLTPSDFNKVKKIPIHDILLEKAKQLTEKKCSENGFVLPGSLKLLSRSMGRFEDGNKTGDAMYYVKLEAQIIYPVDGIKVIGKVKRKNKMGLYVKYEKKGIRIQIPRDFHIGNKEYDSVEVGDIIEVELKRSKFQINDLYILASGIFIKKMVDGAEEAEEVDEVAEEVDVAEEADEVADEVAEEADVAEADVVDVEE